MTTRYRTRGTLDSSVYTQQQAIWQNCSQSSFAQIGAQQLYAVGRLETMTDEVVPHFAKRSKAGEVFFNPLYKNVYNIVRSAGNGPEYYTTNAPINCSGTNRYTGYRTQGNHIESIYSVVTSGALANGTIPPFYAHVSDADVNAAVIEASTKAQDAIGRTDANLWESVAEIDKTLAYLDDTLKSARGVFRRRRIKGAVKGTSSTYLGWRYGVKPLMSDITAVAEGLQKQVGLLRVTSRGKVQLQSNRNRTLTYNGSPFSVSMIETTAHTVVIRAMALSAVQMDLVNRLGFTYKGLVTLPYELLNKSFVLDWFVTLGDYIGALTPAPGWNRLGSCVTIQHDYVTAFNATTTSIASGWSLVRPYSGGLTAHRTMKMRTAGLPFPGIVAKSDFRFDKVDRVLDSLALLAVEILGRDTPPQLRRRFRPSFFDDVKWHLP